MKCEHCGKNEVTFIYQSSVNGRVTERHLCGECARELGYTQKLRERDRFMMHNFFGGEDLFRDMLSPMPGLLGGRRWLLEDPFEELFADMPALCSAGERQQEAPREQKKSDLVDQAEQSRFSRMRQMNALRHEMKAAARQEDFERAARLRDQLRAMESEQQ